MQILDAVLRLRDEFSETLKQAKVEADRFDKAWSAQAKQIERTGKTLQKTGRTMTTAVTLPVAAMATTGVQAAVSFESAMTGVAKTTDLTSEELAAMGEEIKAMSREIPLTREELAGIAESAGQLGIEKANILGFTKTIADLGATTNMTAEQAATEFARFANITGMSQTEFDRLGSTVVALGNNLATTESEIMAMSMRLAAAGAQVGLSEDEIVSLAATMSSLGIEAEAGGSAMSKVFVDMQLASELGGEKLAGFAKVAGQSSEQFKAAFEKDASSALLMFVEGLANAESQGKSAIAMLDEMGITEVRTRDALLRMAGGSDLLAQSLEMGASAWDENSALAAEAALRYETNEAQFTMLKNTLSEVAMVMGEVVLPHLVAVAQKIKALADWFRNLNPETQKSIMQFVLFAATIGPVLMVLGSMLIHFAKVYRSVRTLGVMFRVFGKALKASRVAVLAMNPAVLAVIAVFLAFVAIGYYVGKNWDGIMATLRDGWLNVTQKMNDAYQRLRNWFSNQSAAVKVILFELLSFFTSSFAGGIIGKMPGITQAFGGLITYVRSTFSEGWRSGWESVKQDFFGMVNGMVSGAKKKLDELKGYLPTISMKGILPNAVSRLRGHANGTMFHPGGWSRINERGDEIVKLQSGDKVYPHSRSLAMAYNDGRNAGSDGGKKIAVSFAGAVFHVREKADLDRLAIRMVQRIKLAEEVSPA